ncbi:MAG: hypothetical protein ACJAVK_000919 [Akkermansiaceae bacterium]|jgi:hypothetical protein
MRDRHALILNEEMNPRILNSVATLCGFLGTALRDEVKVKFPNDASKAFGD